jgi:hypothetical protein
MWCQSGGSNGEERQSYEEMAGRCGGRLAPGEVSKPAKEHGEKRILTHNHAHPPTHHPHHPHTHTHVVDDNPWNVRDSALPTPTANARTRSCAKGGGEQGREAARLGENSTRQGLVGRRRGELGLIRSFVFIGL